MYSESDSSRAEYEYGRFWTNVFFVLFLEMGNPAKIQIPIGEPMDDSSYPASFNEW